MLKKHSLIFLFCLFAVFTDVMPSLADTTVGGVISSDTTWTLAGSPYIVTSTVQVYGTSTTPVTLTIQPGVVVKFASGTSLQIGSGASKGILVAKGTDSDRISFTRNAASGNWSNINLQAGATATIENVDVQYSSDIYIYSSSSSFKNSTIKNISGSYGIMYGSANPVLENVTVTTNSSYGMYLNSSSPIITGGSLTNSNATGYGIYGSGSPIISNYNISIINTAGKYGLYLSSASSSLSVTNSTIGNGFYLGTGFVPTITGNTFTNSDNSPPHAGANIIGDLLNNNTFNSLSSAGRIEIAGEQITRNVQWKKYAAPYVVLGILYLYKDTTSASTLTIDPGVTVKFALNTALYIGSGSTKGVLVANGTATLPILFTSSQTTPAAGNWYGLNFSGDAASTSTLSNIIVEYGGYGGSYSNANVALSSSSPTISNATIRNSAGSGIYLSSASSIPRILNSTITANKWGVYSYNSNPLINNSNITGNTTAGVWNSSTTIDIDARGNWWGSATGPSNATSNPSGTGNAISSKVLFNPWLGQTPGTLSITNVRITPAAFNPTGDSTTISATISASASWKITISDSNASQVKTFNGSGTSINQVWSGENSANVKVADGTYNVLIEATDASSNTATPIIGTVKVSSAIPVAIINSPADNLMVQGGATIDIYATTTDATDFKNYTLEYGSGEAPVSWSTFVGATTTQPANAKIYSWNTGSYTGGVYTLRLTATDNAGNTQVKTTRVRLLWISSNSQSETYISPNNDGIKDSIIISATSTQPADWNIAISNSGNTVVRTLTTANATTLSQIWDGKDSTGTVVPDGTYTYKLIATDSASGVQSTAKTGTILSDITTPTVTISSPLPGGLLRNSVTVTGTASDANIVSYTLDYGPSNGNGPWTVINSATSSVSSATLGTWVTNDQGGTVPLANGSYQLRLMATDKAGNSAGFMIPVIADNLNLGSITVNTHAINTATAETSTVSFSINAPATVTFKIIPEKQGANGTPVYQSSKTLTAAGSSSFTWDGKDSTTKVVPDEAYIYTLNATDGTRTDSYAPAALTGTGSITCSQSNYNPITNMPMTITYTPAQPSRVNINISWGSQNFKIMDAVPSMAATKTFEWNGRNPSQKILASGATALCSIASLLPENHIITTGNTSAPSVTILKTDPYQMSLAYGQFSRIKFTLTQKSNVTIKLVSPSGATATLVSNLLQEAGSYNLEWTSADLTDANGKAFLVSEDGDYMVSVEAINPATGTSSTTLGNLRVGL